MRTVPIGDYPSRPPAFDQSELFASLSQLQIGITVHCPLLRPASQTDHRISSGTHTSRTLSTHPTVARLFKFPGRQDRTLDLLGRKQNPTENPTTLKFGIRHYRGAMAVRRSVILVQQDWTTPRDDERLDMRKVSHSSSSFVKTKTDLLPNHCTFLIPAKQSVEVAVSEIMHLRLRFL